MAMCVSRCGLCYREPTAVKRPAYREIVRDAVARSYSALVHADGPVHVRGAVLEKPMEVQTGVFVAQAVVEIDNQTVALSDLNCRYRPLPIDLALAGEHQPGLAHC